MGRSDFDWIVHETSIERTIYQYCCSLPDLAVHSLLCSNIIDLTCPRAKKLFSAEVWSDFEAQFPALPPSTLEVIEGLGVHPMTLDSLASLLAQMPRPSSVTPAMQHWLFNVCYGLSEPHPLRRLHPLQRCILITFLVFFCSSVILFHLTLLRVGTAIGSGRRSSMVPLNAYPAFKPPAGRSLAEPLGNSETKTWLIAAEDRNFASVLSRVPVWMPFSTRGVVGNWNTGSWRFQPLSTTSLIGNGMKTA